VIRTHSADELEVTDPSKIIAPGDYVQLKNKKGEPDGWGFVISILQKSEDECVDVTVFWSVNPKQFDFSNFAMPLVRRVWTPMIVSQLVSIQPMTLPSGIIFSMSSSYSGSI
jgi:hypothetical protein